MALQKNKREICKDKQILMISRFYKPAFVILFFSDLFINERDEKMQEKSLVQEYEKYKAQGGTKYKILSEKLLVFYA